MTARLAADALLLLHLLYIGFVIFGGLLVIRWPVVALAHLPNAAWGAFVELSGRGCPLTGWEIDLRRAAGESGFTDSFIEHYLLPVIYPAGLTRNTQFWLAGFVIVINFAIYGYVMYRRARKSHA